MMWIHGRYVLLSSIGTPSSYLRLRLRLTWLPEDRNGSILGIRAGGLWLAAPAHPNTFSEHDQALLSIKGYSIYNPSNTLDPWQGFPFIPPYSIAPPVLAVGGHTAPHPTSPFCLSSYGPDGR